MSFFDKFHKNSSQVEQSEQLSLESMFDENQTVAQKAEKAANMISEYVDKGDFSDINDLLDEVIQSNERTQFVFEQPNPKKWYLVVGLSALFILLFAVFLVISLGTAVFSNQFRIISIVLGLISLAFIMLNILSIKKAVQEIKFSLRYAKYYDCIKYHTIMVVADLASFAQTSLKKAVEDIKAAISRSYIPQGHFGNDNKILIVSDEKYHAYLEHESEYNHYFDKMVEERERLAERTDDIQRIIDEGNGYVKKIRYYNDIIKDKYITEQLDYMERVVASIFNEVEINPKHADKLGMLISYYLPTTEKLLKTYIDFSEKPISSMSIAKTKKEIEVSLEKINQAYDTLLDQFFHEQEMDISSEIQAMTAMMKQEGLSE